MADRYWVGNSGDCLDDSHWSEISGGTSGANIPTSSDNAIWDGNSFTIADQEVTINEDFVCNDFNTVDVTNLPCFNLYDISYPPNSVIFNTYGNFLVNSSSTFAADTPGSYGVIIHGNSKSINVSTDGTYVCWNFNFSTSGGGSIIPSGDIYAHEISFLTSCVFSNVDSFAISARQYDFENNVSVNFYSCNISVLTEGNDDDGNIYVYGGGGVSIIASDSTLLLGGSGTGGWAFHWSMGGSVGDVPTISFDTIEVISTNPNTLDFSDYSSPIKTGNFTSDEKPLTIIFNLIEYEWDNIDIHGTEDSLVVLESGTPDEQYTIEAEPGETVDVSYVNVSDSIAQWDGDVAPFYDYPGGVDGGNNINWLFTEPPGPPVAEFSATPLSGYSPLTVQFTDESTNTPTSWLWDFGDGETSEEQNPEHEYLGGTYTVSLTATNDFGDDTETKVDYITVLDFPHTIINCTKGESVIQANILG